MNQEDIIRMALDSKSCVKTDCNGVRLIADGLDIERFAALVAAAEREECAKVCEDLSLSQNSEWEVGTLDCADAIRARGQA